MSYRMQQGGEKRERGYEGGEGEWWWEGGGRRGYGGRQGNFGQNRGVGQVGVIVEGRVWVLVGQ